MKEIIKKILKEDLDWIEDMPDPIIDFDLVDDGDYYEFTYDDSLVDMIKNCFGYTPEEGSIFELDMVKEAKYVRVIRVRHDLRRSSVYCDEYDGTLDAVATVHFFRDFNRPVLTLLVDEGMIGFIPIDNSNSRYNLEDGPPV